MTQAAVDTHAERDAYYRRIAQANLAPLWEMMSSLVPEQPRSPCVPAICATDRCAPG